MNILDHINNKIKIGERDFSQIPAELRAEGITEEQWTKAVNEVFGELFYEGKLGPSVIIRFAGDGQIRRYDLTTIDGRPGLKITRLFNPSEIDPSQN